MRMRFWAAIVFVSVLMLAGIGAVTAPMGAHAQEGQQQAKSGWMVDPSGTANDFRLRSSGRDRMVPLSAQEAGTSLNYADMAFLARNLEKGHLRLALDGYFSLLTEKNRSFEDEIWIQPVRRLAGYTGPVLDAGQVMPPQNFDAPASMPIVMADWLGIQSKGAGAASGPEGYRHAWRDPATHSAYMLARQAIMRIAYKRAVDNGVRFSLFNPAQNRTDAIGASVFNGSVIALTKYAAAQMKIAGHPTGLTSPNDYMYAYDANDLYKVRETGPVPSVMLALSGTWAEPWAGLDPYENKTSNIAVGPVSGVMMALLSNAGAQSIKTVLDDPFPYNDVDGPGRSSRAWLEWLDGRIRKTGNGLVPWDQHRQFIAERGLAGAYAIALSDLIAIPERALESGGNRSLPDLFKNGAYLDLVYRNHPCQDFAFSLNNPVQEITLDIPEVASRCVRVRWTGEGFGPDIAAPPVSLSVYGADMQTKDYDAILLSSAYGELSGFTIVDRSTRNGVKVWSLPYRADYKDAEWMTLAFANIAPEVKDTKPRKVKLTLGTGLTSASGNVSKVVDVSKAGSSEECRPQRVTSPEMRGPSPFPLPVMAEADLGALLGLSMLTKNSPRSDASIQIALCSAETFGGSLNSKNEAAMGLKRDASGETRLGCIEKLGAASAMLMKTPTQSEMADISLTAKDGGALDPSAMSIPVDAEVVFFDPSVAAARRSGKVDYRSNATVYMEGIVSFQVRTPTRVRGRVDLKASADSVGDCGESKDTGALTFVFDLVGGMPFSENAVAVPPDVLSTLPPLVWASMTPAQKAKTIAEGKKARDEALMGGDGGGSAVFGMPACDCSCTEFNNPSLKSACSAQCLDYQVTAPQCVIEREMSRGRSRGEVTEKLNACPTDCASFASSDPLCKDAFPMIVKTCAANIVTEADKACYLALFTKDMPEPMKSQMYAEMKSQIASMDQDMLRMTIRPQLDAYEEQGMKCPAN